MNQEQIMAEIAALKKLLEQSDYVPNKLSEGIVLALDGTTVVSAIPRLPSAVMDALDLHCRDKNKLLAVVNRHITDGEIGVYSWGIHVGVWNLGFVNRFTYG